MSRRTLIAAAGRVAALSFTLLVVTVCLVATRPISAAACGCESENQGAQAAATGSCPATGKAVAGPQARATAPADPAKPATQPPADPSAELTSGQAAAGGLRVYVDPQTGEISDPPPGAEDSLPAVAVAPSGSARSAGISNSPVPGGGQMIDTHGQFLHTMKATAGASGVAIGCEER